MHSAREFGAFQLDWMGVWGGRQGGGLRVQKKREEERRRWVG